MLFYRTAHTYRHEGQAGVPATPRPISSPSSEYSMRAPWMLKCLVVGTALLVLAYWLVQIAGAQYLATLTSATLLSFLLVYIVWCLTVKRRQAPQHAESAVTSEPPALPTTSSASTASGLHPALKHYGVPPRECSPPPSYDEVLRQMGAAAAAAAAAASTSGASPSYRYDVEAPPEDLEAASSSASLPVSVCTIESPAETQTNVPNSLEMASNVVAETTPSDACLPSTSTTQDENLTVMSTASTSKTTTPLSDSKKERAETPASSEPTPPLPTPTPALQTPTPPSSTPTLETVGEVGFEPTPAEVAAEGENTTSTAADVSIEIA